MSLIHRRAEEIEEADLQGLVTTQVTEGKFIEYKLTTPGATDNEKKEFLADVSSFANASGGDIVYGVREEGGVAVEVVGLAATNFDAELLRLEETIRNGVAPRIPRVTIRVVPLRNSNAALVIRVPRSFALPHMVTFKGSSRFYSRNSAGKYPLDVAEIRTAFILSETFAERARSFRAERLGNIVADRAPVKLQEPPYGVLHSLPVGAFESGVRLDISPLLGRADQLPPFTAAGGFTAARYNFDGLLSHASSEGVAGSYVQLFHNGVIEAVLADVKDPAHNGRGRLPMKWFEQHLLETLPVYLRAQQEVGAEPPFFLMLSLLGVSDYTITVDDRFRHYRYGQPPIDRDSLLVPESIVEAVDQDPTLVLKPLFDAIWNAAGWPRSMSYDKEGARLP